MKEIGESFRIKMISPYSQRYKIGRFLAKTWVDYKDYDFNTFFVRLSFHFLLMRILDDM